MRTRELSFFGTIVKILVFRRNRYAYQCMNTRDTNYSVKNRFPCGFVQTRFYFHCQSYDRPYWPNEIFLIDYLIWKIGIAYNLGLVGTRVGYIIPFGPNSSLEAP